MKQVALVSNQFEIQFKHDGTDFEGLVYKYISGELIYFAALKDGIKYRTVAKQMYFNENEDVYVTFGDSRLIIGYWLEVE